MRQQMRLDLPDRIQRHGHHNQQGCAAEIEGHRILADQDFRQDTDSRKIGRAKHRQTGQHRIKVIRRRLARTDPRDIAAIFAQVFCRVLRVKDNRRIEKRKEHDQADIDAEIKRLSAAKKRIQCHKPLGTAGLAARQVDHRYRHQQK